jgi:very-short-patch-repair endonuclease
MPSYRKRPRKNIPPPLAGGGKQSDAAHSIAWGRGKTFVSRQLRTSSSEAERKLWYYLKRKQLSGLRFRRQFPLGPYFADFVCLSARLVIEVDGSQHGELAQVAHDARRTAWLERNGFRVLRFWTHTLMTDIEAVMDGIDGALRLPLPRRDVRVDVSSPPPARGGGIEEFGPHPAGRGGIT